MGDALGKIAIVWSSAGLVLLTLVLAMAGRAQAQACTADSIGMVACMAGKLCACRADRGGGVTALPAGARWDCGVLRPGCGPAADVPATLDPYPGLLPEALSLDRSRTTITNVTGGRPKPREGRPHPDR